MKVECPQSRHVQQLSCQYLEGKTENVCRVCSSVNACIGTVSQWTGVLTKSTPSEAAIASEFIDVGVVELDVTPVKRILSSPIAMLRSLGVANSEVG